MNRNRFRDTLKSILKKWYVFFKYRIRGKIFIISMQRNGTKSTSNFFKSFNFPVCPAKIGRENNFTNYWFAGDFDSIFKHPLFKHNMVFDDDPWWCPEFYKFLYHKFPKAKFVLLTRNSEDWFKSMVRHSGGKTPGNTEIHCKIYKREKEFDDLLNQNPDIRTTDMKNLFELEGHEAHYRELYEIRNRQVIDFFNMNNPKRLFICELDDDKKWQKIGQYFGFHVPSDFESHKNKAK